MTEPPKNAAKKEANEKARAEKAAKFAAKQEKLKQQNANKSQSQKQQQPKKPVETLPPFEDPTNPGDKKVIQSFDAPHFQAYNPKAVESSWYAWWEKSGFFKPESRDTSNAPGTFVVPIPPPNVTGALHLGHALANSLQDTLIRFYRMKGFTTLWVPGCDHAGISTQSVVEKTLWAKEQKTRYDLGREKFTSLVWDWKKEYHERINNATKKMGGSMDWSREAFTMDENLSAATMEAFCRLYDEGYIYRSNRLVNWCTQLSTALSTLEVENKEITGRTLLSVPGYDRKVEFGVLTHFKYQIDGSTETVEVATTRPETMLGDSGIAVHPDDTRYSHLVGKSARHPFTDRLLPIVKDTYVDPEFGTGAVKLTPAHDFNDYNLGQRHGLEFVNILNEDGTLNSNAGSFQGQRRFDARYGVVEELTKLGLFVKKESNAMKIPLCEKSKDVIEPLIKPQWWVRMNEMAESAIQAAEDGKITFAPESAKKSYHRWLANINDWCISRQLWWGHRIPAYQVIFEGEQPSDSLEDRWVVAKTPEEAESKAKAQYGDKKFHLERDADCLDTWFSSGLWPMATLGWPNTDSLDLKKYFPTSLLETGWDILFFWVSRMIMLSLKLTGQVPFSEVYCHSLIRDSEGRKMSKSLGNVVDPLDVINGIDLESLHAKLLVGNLKQEEVARATKYQKSAFPGGIPECGADALRFTLLSYVTGGGDLNFDIKVMHAYRRFCNKIWQASKYVMGRLPADFAPVASLDVSKLSLPERWILHRMNCAVKAVNDALEARNFSQCTQSIYQFFYDELCDVFIENSKSILTDGTPEEQASAQQTLYHALDVALRLLHPVTPFISEELWQRLPRKEGDQVSIMLAPYPTYESSLEFEAEATKYELGLKCVQGIRSLASEFGIRTNGNAFVKAVTADSYANVEPQAQGIKALCGKAVSELKVLGPDAPEGSAPRGCAIFVINADIVVMLDVAAGIKDMNAEIKKIQGKLQKSQAASTKQRELMANEGFFDNASEVVRSTEEKKLADAEAASENYKRTIEEFEKMSLGS